MTRLDKPPTWKEAFKDEANLFIKLLGDPGIADFVNRMNDKYYYWDELKYRPQPNDITPAMGWFFVKLSRMVQRKLLSLNSKDGEPFGYWLPDSVLKELHFIDQNATGQLLVDDPTVGTIDKDRYIISSLMEEAIASSLLEGAATIRKKAKEMLREGRKPLTKGELMIQNNYSTMVGIKDRLKENLSIELLCEIQASITKGTLEDPAGSGRLRKQDDDIHVVDMTDGTILHAPPAADDLIPRLKKLCDFANESPENTFLHPVVKGIILHFWLAYEHPFVDGNGRTARALLYWFLLKNKYWLIEFLPISRIILKAPTKYKMAFLYSEEDDEDLTYFISFNLRAFRLSIEDLRKYVLKKQRELTEANKYLKKYPSLNHRQQELINHAIHHPDATYTISHHCSIHGIVYETGRTDLLQLVKRGLFTKIRGGHTYFFSPSDDLPKKLRPSSRRKPPG